jgi:hypothetical protein
MGSSALMLRWCGIFLLALAAAASLIFQPTPLVPKNGPPGPVEAVHARWFLGQVHRVLSAPARPHRIFATSQTLAARMAGHGLSPVRFGAGRQGQALRIAITIPVVSVWPWRYANLSLKLKTNGSRAYFGDTKIGHMPIPSWTNDFVLQGLFNQLCPQAGLTLHDLAQDLDFHATNMIGLTATAPPCLANAARAQRRKFSPIDPARVAFYRDTIQTALCTRSGWKTVPLEYALRAAFQTAKRQPTDAKSENLAALVALATFSGGARLGDVLDVPGRQAARCPLPELTLLGRADLAKHFSVSAGLTALFAGQLSWAAGEWKELLDSSAGGSGFSFVDLAADRAGVRFALRAMTNDGREVQMLGAGVTARDLLPLTQTVLREGMRDQQFQSLYGDVRDPRYQLVVRAIDRTLETSSVYASAPKPTEDLPE